MISYNNCDSTFAEEGFQLIETHFYSSGFGTKTYQKNNMVITFYLDDLTKENEFIIGKGEREVIYVGKISSTEFFKELIKNIDYEYNV